MQIYYMNQNAQPNGDYEVHGQACSFLPAEKNRVYLGFFSTCHDAVREAKKHAKQVNGCYYCANDCHTT